MSVAYTSLHLLRDLAHHIAPYKGKFFLGFICRLISDLAWLYPAYALASIVNFITKYTPGDSYEPLYQVLIFWGIAILLHIILRPVAKYYGYQVSEKVCLDVQFKTLRHLLQLDLAWQERENTGNKLKRILSGGEGFDQIIRMFFDYMVEICVNFVGMIFIVATFDGMIAGLMVAFMVIFLTVSLSLTRKAARHAHLVNVQSEEVVGVGFEAINNVQTVKVLRMQSGILKNIKRSLTSLFQKIRKRIFWFRFREGVMGFIGQGFRFGIIGFIIWGIFNGKYEAGFLILFVGYFDKIWESVSEVAHVSNEFIVSKYAIHRLMDILNEPVRIADETGKKPFNKDWKTIQLKNLSFTYETHPVLKNLNLTLKRGEKIGIVGLSGAGKSTLFRLFLKQREGYKGEILFDDQRLLDTKKSSYLRHVAVVLQDTELFNLTLEQNILLAAQNQKKNATKLNAALRIAHIKEFLPKLPKGIHTLIGEKGVKLSGGEKQRLGIARAVYRQPEILFLDEATSHLDVESEQKIQDALHQVFQNVTAIVIAHRLSTVKEMDRILVLEKGKIIEEGNFKSLMKQKGRFFEMWEKQKFE